MFVSPWIVIGSVENLFRSVSKNESNDLVPCSVLIRLRVFMGTAVPCAELFDHPFNLTPLT